jgi:hypothetical protein
MAELATDLSILYCAAAALRDRLVQTAGCRAVVLDTLTDRPSARECRQYVIPVRAITGHRLSTMLTVYAHARQVQIFAEHALSRATNRCLLCWYDEKLLDKLSAYFEDSYLGLMHQYRDAKDNVNWHDPCRVHRLGPPRDYNLETATLETVAYLRQAAPDYAITVAHTYADAMHIYDLVNRHTGNRASIHIDAQGISIYHPTTGVLRPVGWDARRKMESLRRFIYEC